MNIGIVGLGKLGLPVALALDLKGHDVMGLDIYPSPMPKDRSPQRTPDPLADRMRHEVAA